MAVQLLDEGLGPVLLLMPLLGMCKGPPHTIVDHNIVLVSFQQSRTCSIAQRRPLEDSKRARDSSAAQLCAVFEQAHQRYLAYATSNMAFNTKL